MQSYGHRHVMSVLGLQDIEPPSLAVLLWPSGTLWKNRTKLNNKMKTHSMFQNLNQGIDGPISVKPDPIDRLF